MQVDSLEQVGSSIRVRMRIKGIPLWWIGIIIVRKQLENKERASSSTGVAVKGIIKSITGGSGIVSERR